MWAGPLRSSVDYIIERKIRQAALIFPARLAACCQPVATRVQRECRAFGHEVWVSPAAQPNCLAASSWLRYPGPPGEG
jgi:hypothetical protein